MMMALTLSICSPTVAKFFNLVVCQGCAISEGNVLLFCVWEIPKKRTNLSHMDFHVCFDIVVAANEMLDCIWGMPFSDI